MKRKWILNGLLVLLLAATPVALAANGFSLDWRSVNSGGGSLEAGGYHLESTIGQPAAGSLENGGYTLNAGFQLPLAAVENPLCPGGYCLYLPLLRR